MPRAFWYLGRRRLVVAVMRRYLDEPLMIACAMAEGTVDAGDAERSPFAPGLLDAARAVGGRDLEHAAALSKEFCRLVDASEAAADGDRQQGWCRFAVHGMEGATAYADPEAVAAARGLFRDCGLELRALDCEECALATLGLYLGSGGGDAVDPLAAVELREECIGAATAIGPGLAVPVGLALSRLGGSNLRAIG